MDHRAQTWYIRYAKRQQTLLWEKSSNETEKQLLFYLLWTYTGELLPPFLAETLFVPHTVVEEEDEDRMPALAMTRSLPILSGCSFNLNPHKQFSRIRKGKGISFHVPCQASLGHRQCPKVLIQEDIYLAADTTPLLLCAIQPSANYGFCCIYPLKQYA